MISCCHGIYGFTSGFIQAYLNSTLVWLSYKSLQKGIIIELVCYKVVCIKGVERNNLPIKLLDESKGVCCIWITESKDICF